MKKNFKIFLLGLSFIGVLVSCGDDEDAPPTPEPVPVADFSFTTEETSVTFTNSSKDATAFAWDFGDGGTSTDKDPSHTYDEGGTFHVKLTVTGKGGTDDVTKDVVIESVGDEIELTFDLSWPEANGYEGATLTLSEEEKDQIADALGLSIEEITASLDAADGTVTFYAIEGTEISDQAPTANGYGYWYAADGTVTTWGVDARAYSEFNQTDYLFALGHYPGQALADDEFTIKQALATEGGMVTFVFNITIE